MRSDQPAQPPLVFEVSSPPSLNKLWIHAPSAKGGRVKSKEYRDWQAVAGWQLRIHMAGKPIIASRYDMEIQVPISRRDTGNWEKAIGDALEKCGVVTNDGNINNLTIRPVERDNCRISIILLPDLGGVRPPPKPRVTKSNAARKMPHPRSAVTSQKH